MNFRKGNQNDLTQFKELGIKSWTEYKKVLTPENWEQLSLILNDENTYNQLLKKSTCIVCENLNKEIIGMAFLVPKGNPDTLYHEDWCHLRFVTVNPFYRRMQIGEKLIRECIKIAQKNNEEIMALHTAEIMQSAQSIYKKLGFTILKEIEPRLGVRYWLYTYDLKRK